MSISEMSMSGYLHTYEAYRVPKGTAVKDMAGEDVVLSNEEEAHKEKMKKLNDESNAAATNAVEGPQHFSNAQKNCIVEIDASGVDFSAMEVMSLGAGVTGMHIDLSV